jgi:hypothetical protein
VVELVVKKLKDKRLEANKATMREKEERVAKG